MKKFIASLFLVLATRLLAVAPVPLTEGVSFSFRISGVGNGIMSVYDEAGTPSLGHTTNNATTESAISTAWLRPGKQYAVNFQASGPYEFWLSYIAPAGYVLLVNDQPTTISYASPGGGWYSYNYTVELKPLASYQPAQVASFSGIDVGKSITWEVGTGMLYNNRTAGRIIFKELDLSDSPASRARLYYSVSGNYGELTVIKDGASNQTLRQIATPQGFLDFVDVTNDGYWINCYQNSQVQSAPSGQTWVIIPGQSPWKTIRVQSPAANQLKITETEGSVSRVSLLALTSGSVSSGNFVWTLREGDGNTWLRTTKHTSTKTGYSATGGTMTTSGGYNIHTFTASGTFTVNAAPSGATVDALIVGGGGGGSNGGGGSGGVISQTGISVSNGSYTVTVGAGGAGQHVTTMGGNGGNSSFAGNTANGGGGGGSYGAAGAAGGSGGGGGRNYVVGAAGGAGTAGQGKNGGAADGGFSVSGGGGGAGTVGVTGDSTIPKCGDGGAGATNSITGTAIYYGGGGGGGTSNGDSYWAAVGAGGLGGGGAGGNNSGGVNGTNGLGGGGGGADERPTSTSWTGGTGGSGVVIIRYAGSTTNYRDDVVEVRTGDVTGTLVSKTKYHFVAQPWGEEVTQVIADPDGAALTTTYDYYTNSAAPGNYRKVKSVISPTGAWSASQYYDDWNRRGQLQYQFQPYLDAPATVTLNPAQGRVVSMDYAADWTGRYTRPTIRQEKINNVLTGQTTWTHGDITGGGSWPHEYAYTYSYRDGTNYQTDYEEHYRGDAPFGWANRSYVVKAANQTQASISEISGSLNASTGVFTATGGADPNWRQLVLHGSTSSTNAESVSSWGGQTFAAIYMVPYQSTMSAVINDTAGNTIRTESYVYTGSGNFSLIAPESLTYDAGGRLTQRVSGNGSGATTTNTYTNGYLTSTVGVDGTENQFTYDLIGRVATSVKKGAAASGSYAAQSDITTTYTYDGLGHAVQTVSAGGSLSQTTTSTYDLAGRLTQTVAPGSYTTGFAYSSGGKIVTATLPGGATKISETFLDGQLKSMSGTGVVAENYDYLIDSGNGQRLRQSFYGGNYSAFTNTYWDWLGRQVAEWKPRSDGNNWANLWTYNNSGQLTKVSQPGRADTLYVYDSLGQVVREGLDVNANGTLDLASDDRITDHIFSLVIDGLGRATRGRQTKVYASSGSGTSTLTSVHSEILSGLSAGQIVNNTDLDIYGNATYTSTSVDRANKKVTSTVNVPTSSTTAQQITYNGLLMSARDTSNITMTYGYDALGRQTTSVDPRTGTTTTAYVTGTNQVLSVTDPASVAQATYTYDSAGRAATVTNGLGKVCRYDYTARGEKLHVWGDTDYPVEYGYDAQGRQTTMKTYRAGTGFTGSTWPTSTVGTADTTTWNFHTATGLLSSKVDAAGKSVAYTYTVAGQIATRAWARFVTGTTPVTTTYAYSSTTGELTSVSYNDGTSSLAYTYNRLGQQATVADGTGTRTFNYNLSGTLELQSEDLPSFYDTRRIGRGYDTTTAGAIGRYNKFYVTNSAHSYDGYDMDIGYDASGRLNKIFNVFTYDYVANSNLIASVGMASGTGWGWNYSDTRTYNSAHDWVASRTMTKGSTVRTAFAYTFDNLGRQTAVVKTGEVFNRYGNGTEGLKTSYGYDDRSQLTSEQTKVGATATVLTGRDDSFAFDNIGNRATATHNGNTATYTPNNLNQYSQRTVPGVFDVAGAAASAATVTVNGSSTGVTRHGDYFFKGHALTNTSSAVYSSLSISDGTTTTALSAFLPATPEPFTYDADGNLTSDGRWDYTYDAENRLVSMQTHTAFSPGIIPNADARRLEFKYDYLGRRVQKVVRTGYNGTSYSATPSTDLHNLYDGWNLIWELDATASLAKVRGYVWGLDLSGSLQGAGGVGGLLYVWDAATSASYIPAYDAMGNVHGYINAGTGTLAAAFEYDAFGNTLRESGTFAGSARMRFSTKYTDLETGLVYYGLRYYSPFLGRFINKDPIEEAGGLNLYGFCGNNGVNRWDLLGNVAKSEFENEGWTIYGNGGMNGPQSISEDGQTITVMTGYNRETGESRFATHQVAKETWVDNIASIGCGVIASIVTFGAASPAAIAWTGSTIVGGALAGAAAGVASQYASTLSTAHLGSAALAGAIGGAVGGYYGNNWTVGRVAATTVASGLASEVSGGSFRQGALIGGAIALATFAALEMRDYEWRHSPPEAQTGQSAGVLDDGHKLGGARPHQVGINPETGRPVLEFRGSLLGGDQGGQGKLMGTPYAPGSGTDRLVEVYAGVHDFLNDPWSYNSNGYNQASNSTLGRLFGSPKIANAVSGIMNWVNVPIATPLVAVSVVGMSPALTTFAVRGVAQNQSKQPPWGP